MVAAVKSEAPAALVNQLAAALDLDFQLAEEPNIPAPAPAPPVFVPPPPPPPAPAALTPGGNQ
jgi:hypothetical protein